MRYTFLRWLTYQVFKTPENIIPNKFIRLIHFILFPLHYFYEKQSQVKYDRLRNTYTIREIEFSAYLFDMISKDAEKNRSFKFLKNEDGIVTIKNLDTKPSNELVESIN